MFFPSAYNKITVESCVKFFFQICLTLFFCIHLLSAAPVNKYIVIVTNPLVKTSPKSSASDKEKGLKFGSLIFSDRVIENEDDFDFLEVRDPIHHDHYYIPLEMVMKAPNVKLIKNGNHVKIESRGYYPLLYVPEGLTTANTSYSYDNRQIAVDKSMIGDLYALIGAARQKGHMLYIARGYSELSERISRYEAALARDPKQSTVKKPFLSEYASGRVVDFTDENSGTDYERFAQDGETYEWIRENAHLYGFAPTDKHYRFLYTGKRVERKIDTQTLPDYIKKKVDLGSICTIHILKKKNNPRVSYIWVHNNEKSAGKTLEYALNTYGGHSIYIQNRDRRNLYIKYGRKYYAIDPNRLFTDKGVHLFLQTYYPRSSSKTRRAILKKAQKVRATIIDHFDWGKDKYLIALHSSKPDSKFSIQEFNKKNAYLTYTNPNRNPKNLFLTTSMKDYYFFKSQKMNVVYQKTIENDGSLSVYAAQHNLPYINIEVEEGDDEIQQKMLDKAIECINQNYKDKSL